MRGDRDTTVMVCEEGRPGVDASSAAVALAVSGAAHGQLHRVVEGALGWQVVDVDDTVLPPAFVLADTERAVLHAGGLVPIVLVVLPEDDPVAAARAGRHATAVVRGVPDAPTLQRALSRTVAAAPPGRAPWCTVVAGAGGVGATTVATALAGLRAWAVGPTLLAARGPTHQEGAPRVAPADLASSAVWAAAVPVVGIADCRVVGLREGPPPVDAGPVPLVLELGVVAGPADLVVVRPDRAGLVAAGAAIAEGAGTVVVVGRGGIEPASFHRAAAGRSVLHLPWSSRVAAATAAGRLPTDVPGRWLRPLAAVVEALADTAATP